MEDPDFKLQTGARALALAEELIRNYSARSLTIALAESCTAGLAADFLARVPGASSVLWGSFVCYTLEAKVSMLELDRGRLARYGLVSRETACDMAVGALEKSGACVSAAVTGLAGPDGDGSAVPVGTVFAAAATREKGITGVKEFHFSESRNRVRALAALEVLTLLIDNII